MGQRAPAVRRSLPIPWGQPHQTPPMTACLPERSLKPRALQMPTAES